MLEQIIEKIRERESIARNSGRRDPIYDSTTYSLCRAVSELYVSGVIGIDKFKEYSTEIHSIEFEIWNYYSMSGREDDRSLFYKSIFW